MVGFYVEDTREVYSKYGNYKGLTILEVPISWLGGGSEFADRLVCFFPGPNPTD
jgi:hypothetical protein